MLKTPTYSQLLAISHWLPISGRLTCSKTGENQAFRTESWKSDFLRFTADPNAAVVARRRARRGQTDCWSLMIGAQRRSGVYPALRGVSGTQNFTHVPFDPHLNYSRRMPITFCFPYSGTNRVRPGYYSQGTLRRDLLDEASLISRAVQGDMAAWEPVVLAHQEAVFRLAYLILGDPDDAQDVAQETFVRAWRNLRPL